MSVVGLYGCCFFFKQKTAYEMRISDWSSDVCSSELVQRRHRGAAQPPRAPLDDHDDGAHLGDALRRIRGVRKLGRRRPLVADIAREDEDALRAPGDRKSVV